MLALVFEITAKFETSIPVDDRTQFLQIVTQSHNFNSLSLSFINGLHLTTFCIFLCGHLVRLASTCYLLVAQILQCRSRRSSIIYECESFHLQNPSNEGLLFFFYIPLYISLSILESQAFWSYICVWLLLSGIALSKVFISSDTSDYRALLLLQNPMAS